MKRPRIYRKPKHPNAGLETVSRPVSRGFSRWLLLVLILTALVPVAIWFVVALLRQPPMDSINRCRRALTNAKQVEAEAYAPALYHSADSGWSRLIREWQYQNSKGPLTRNFGVLAAIAEESASLAEQCSREAILVRDSLSGLAFKELAPLRSQLIAFRGKFDAIPLPKSLRDRVAASELSVSESQAAYNRRDYPRAVDKLDRAKHLFGESEREASAIMNDYLKDLPRWREWSEKTIAWSKKTGEIALVVDKMGHRCKVYEGGRLKKGYPVEFGPNWLGDKVQRGDGATPEGEYHIVGKRGKGRTEYYEALDIDYPNSRDRQQFQTAKSKGHISPSAKLGGSIQLHGGGGRGVNWTEGCVALTNADIDELYAMVKVGTPAAIVGALEEWGNH